MNKGYIIATIMFGAVTFAGGFLLRPVLWAEKETAEETAVMAEEPQPGVNVQETDGLQLSTQELVAQGYLSLETFKVRIDDGEIQWYDGMVWHTAATVEEMEKEDKFCAAEEGFRNFEEQMKQQLEAQRAEQVSAVEQGETLLVGQKVEPKPTEKPKTTKPAVTAPVTNPEPETVVLPESNAGGDSEGGAGGGSGNTGNTGGGNSGGGTGGSSGNTGSAGGGNSGGGTSGGSGNTGEAGDSNPGGETGGDSGNTGGTGGDTSGGETGGDSGDTGSTGGDSGNSGTDTGDGENMEWSDDYL